jgi:hypothetical protein
MVKDALRVLFHRAVNYHSSPDGITNEDVYNMLVKQEDQPRLRFIENELGELDIQGINRKHTTINSSIQMPNGHMSRIQIGLTTPLTGLLPSYATTGFLGDAHMPGEQREKLQRWIETRFNVGVRFAMAWEVIDQLNDRLVTLPQMRFYCDGLVTLFDMSEGLKDIADALRERTTMPKTLPSSPPELHQEAIKATKTIGWAKLFPVEDAPKTPTKPVTFFMWDEQQGGMPVPWGDSYRRSITVW